MESNSLPEKPLQRCHNSAKLKPEKIGGRSCRLVTSASRGFTEAPCRDCPIMSLQQCWGPSTHPSLVQRPCWWLKSSHF